MKQLENHSYIITKAIDVLTMKAKSNIKTIRKVCFDVKYVMEVLRRDDAHEQLPILRLKIDYELATLYDAMKVNDQVEMIKSKERLESLRKQWMELKEI